MTEPLQVTWYTDPHNIWCWGCEPMMRRLEVVYADVVRLEVRQGGLFEDFTPLREQWARMSGGRWTESVRAFFEAVSSQHLMPMDSDRMIDQVDDFNSTWPACVAAKAASLQGADEGWRYLRACAKLGASMLDRSIGNRCRRKSPGKWGSTWPNSRSPWRMAARRPPSRRTEPKANGSRSADSRRSRSAGEKSPRGSMDGSLGKCSRKPFVKSIRGSRVSGSTRLWNRSWTSSKDAGVGRLAKSPRSWA